MAENVAITPGVGDVVGADDIGGVKYQRIKMIVGADGTNDGDVASGNPLPVTDSANEALLTTIDADTSSIATDTGTIAGDTTSIDGKITACNTGAVTVAASALPTGAATAAKQDTIIGHVDGIETLLGTIDADTSTIAGDTTSIDGKITACNTGAVTVAASALPTGASTEATLSTLNGKVTACNTGAVVLAAGSAAIGKLAANSGVDIGDVDVTSCALPTGAATSAKQDTIIGHVDGVETLLGTIDADTSSLAGCVGGTEVQVDVVGSLPAGTNAIGKLAANSGVDIGDVDVLSLPALAAGTNNIGDVDVLSFASGKTIKRAVISAASSGDNTIVAAVADKKIKVLSVCLVATAAVTVRFESGASGDALTGVISLDAKSGFILPAPADPSCHWIETGVNTLLNLELGGAVQVSGMLTYYEEA